MPEQQTIEGLPPGAVLRPIGGGIEGLPPGATLRPVNQSGQDAAIDKGLAEHPQPPPYMGFDPSNIAKNVWQGAKGLFGGIGSIVSDAVSNPNWVTGTPERPSTLEKFAMQPMEHETEKAGEGFAKGDTLPAYGHVLASAIPFAGPWAASLGEQAGSGDVGGAAGEVAGTTLVPYYGKEVGKAGLRKAAEPFMRTGLGLTRKNFGYDREPVKSVLKETEGLTSGSTAASIKTRLGKLGEAAGGVYKNDSAIGKIASLQPAIDVLQEEYKNALDARRTDLANNIQANIDRLSTDPRTGQPSTDLPPDQLWKIKTGQGDITNWNPDIDPKIRAGIERRVYGAMKGELNRVSPDATPFIDRYSSLKPAAMKANIAERAPGVVENTLSRVGRPTGGAAVGLYELMKGNPLSAAAALLGPEFLSSPNVRIPIARALYRMGGGERLAEPVPPTPWQPPRGFLSAPHAPPITPPIPQRLALAPGVLNWTRPPGIPMPPVPEQLALPPGPPEGPGPERGATTQPSSEPSRYVYEDGFPALTPEERLRYRRGMPLPPGR